MSRLARFPACVRAFEAELDVVHRALRRFGVGGSDTEDLAQEVFLVMWRRWSDYDPQRPLRPWLLGITFKVAQDHQRRRCREVPVGLIELPGQLPGPDQELAAQRARTLVRSALGALPDHQRTLMILHDLDGLAMPEIAGVLSEPLSTLYSRLHTARRSFARAVRRLEQMQALALPPWAVPAGWLAVERHADPPAEVVRARILRKVRALAPAATGMAARPAERPRPAATRLAVGAGGAGAVGRVALLALLWSRPAADARAADGARMDRPATAAASGHGPRVRGRRGPRPASRLAAAAIAPDSLASSQLGAGLVGYWRFDDGAGSTAARDLSGHGGDCVLHGLDPQADWVDGRLAGAVNLNGKGWLACPSPPFGRTPDLTVAAWVKRTRAQKGMRVVATRQLGGGAKDHFFFGFFGDKLGIASHVWNGTLRHPLAIVAGGPDSRWTHLAAVHRDGRVTLFVDGLPVAERRSYRGRTVEAATPLLIGAGVNGPDPSVTTQRLIGAIDELLVYNRPLAHREIGALAEGAQPRLSR
jgi:RNA polymerase sigma-70 factor, ECF subfamily